MAPTARRGAPRSASPQRASPAPTVAAPAAALLAASRWWRCVAVVLALPLFRKAVTELDLPLNHADVIRQQAADKHLDPALIAAVIYAETKFDARTSPAGAQGLMQIMPETAQFLAKRSGAKTFQISDLATPQVNIAYGSYLPALSARPLPRQRGVRAGGLQRRRANVDRWVAGGAEHGPHADDRRDPVPRDARVRAAGAAAPSATTAHTYASQLGYQ